MTKPQKAQKDPEYDAKLTKALQSGAKMHAFTSGGGLRVFRLEKAGKLVGYGEHCNALEALALLVEDYEAGGRPYHEVYGTFDGPDGKYQMYLTGSSTPEGEIDEWLLKGYTIDARFEDGRVSVTKNGYAHWDIPKEIRNWTESHPGEPKEHAQRGFLMETTYFTEMFANREPGWQTRTLKCPPGIPAYKATHWQYRQTGLGSTFISAFINAETGEQEEYEGYP
jgi:hypothetical protein